MAKLAKLTNFRLEVMTFPKISRHFFDYFPKLVDIFLILLTLKGTLPRLSSWSCIFLCCKKSAIIHQTMG